MSNEIIGCCGTCKHQNKDKTCKNTSEAYDCDWCSDWKERPKKEQVAAIESGALLDFINAVEQLLGVVEAPSLEQCSDEITMREIKSKGD